VAVSKTARVAVPGLDQRTNESETAAGTASDTPKSTLLCLLQSIDATPECAMFNIDLLQCCVCSYPSCPMF